MKMSAITPPRVTCALCATYPFPLCNILHIKIFQCGRVSKRAAVLQKPAKHGKGHRVGRQVGRLMAVFRCRHFAGEIILWAVRWYCRYGISYRELEEMMSERGVTVDHTTLYRWTQRYAPELEKRSAWYRSRLSFSWRVDETYVRVKGCWKYLYQAIDKDGATLDFYLADRRNAHFSTFCVQLIIAGIYLKR